VQDPEAEQVQALMEFCDATTDDMTKVKCIGTLECLAQNVEAVDANKVKPIDEFMLKTDLLPDYFYLPSHPVVFPITLISRVMFAGRFSAHRHLLR
jgi:hypothetical protein